MNELPLLIVVLSNATLLALGGVLTHLVIRAARRTGEPELRYLGVGFGLVTLSLLFGGGVVAVVGDVAYGVATRTAFTALGFALVLYSLWLRDRPRARSIRAR